MENAIQLKNIKKIFRYFKKDYMVFYWLFTKKGYTKEFRVLDGLTLDIKKGEIVGILGKNGAGKSTLLKIISGIYFPTSGKVEVDGTIASLIELSAGFNRELTGRENIYLKGSLMGLNEEYIDEHIEEIIDFADIGDYIDMPLRTYSSGMSARIGFSLAVNAQPDVLIIDEVFAVGDKNFQKKSRAKTEELLTSGKTVLFVSHSENLIRTFCTRVIYLKDGKIAYDGEVEKGLEIYHADNLKVPKRNMLVFDEYEIITDEETSEKQVRLRFEYGLIADFAHINNGVYEEYKPLLARYNLSENAYSEPNVFDIVKVEKVSDQLLDIYVNLNDVIDSDYFTIVFNHALFKTSVSYRNSVNKLDISDEDDSYKVSIKSVNNKFAFSIETSR